jgi:rfaE bifunctional protein nucleotidyltransferase chain/domain
VKQILNISQGTKRAQTVKKAGQKIVLAGGCFDILHLGHLTFLEKAKSQGDVLFILLESDKAIKRIKGPDRPINPQLHRAKLLAALRVVDFVILLPEMTDKDSYDNLVKKISPDIIATTKGDSGFHHKARQAKMVGAKLISVISRIPEKSSSKIIEVVFEL